MIDQPGANGSEQRHAQFVARLYPSWYVKLCMPVTLSLAAYNWPEAEKRMEHARQQQDSLDAIARVGLELVLEAQHFFLVKHRDGVDESRQLWPKLRKTLAEETGHSSIESLRIRQLIIHRCQADMHGWETLEQDEVLALLERLGPDERYQYLWHELAMHSYRRGWDNLLKQAYSELSMSNDGLMGSWFYQHSRLMLNIHTDKAQRQDVDSTLATLSFPSQVDDLRETVLPVLRERNWLTEQQLAVKTNRLKHFPPLQ